MGQSFALFSRLSRSLSQGDVPVLHPAPEEFQHQPGVRGIFFESLPWHGETTWVFSWLGIPEGASAEHPAPGILLVHGGGATALADWVRLWVSRGYVALAMDTCGGIPAWSENPYSLPQWPRHPHSGPPGWGCLQDSFLPLEEQWVYHGVGAVLGGRRLLASLPQTAPGSVGVTGISWGGFLCCLAAAWEPSFAYAIPVYGCGGFQTGDSNLVGQQESPEERERWFSLWDPDLFLAQAKMPFLWLTDAEDECFPLPSWAHSTTLPQGPCRQSLRVDYPHDHTRCWQSHTIFDFAGAIREKTPLPVLGKVEFAPEGRVVSCPAELAGRQLLESRLHVTRASGHWGDRRWRPLPAQWREGRLWGTLPPDACGAFFQLRDERQSLWSSPPLLLS
ncbi:MAG: alpha/beta hydrolase family protein [Oligosphaeraceae bacterium]